jgi:hypothetical protein
VEVASRVDGSLRLGDLGYSRRTTRTSSTGIAFLPWSRHGSDTVIEFSKPGFVALSVKVNDGAGFPTVRPVVCSLAQAQSFNRACVSVQTPMLLHVFLLPQDKEPSGPAARFQQSSRIVWGEEAARYFALESARFQTMPEGADLRFDIYREHDPAYTKPAARVLVTALGAGLARSPDEINLSGPLEFWQFAGWAPEQSYDAKLVLKRVESSPGPEFFVRYGNPTRYARIWIEADADWQGRIEGKLKVWGVRGNTPENRAFTIASKEQYWRW